MTPSDPLAAFRAAFPVAESWIYFNHAAVAPWATPVARAMEAFTRDAVANGSVHFESWLETREVTRARAARLLGAQPGEIAFTTSTSQGLITVAEGIAWASGDEILVIQDDFPANHIPWFRQERFGARVVVVPRQGGRVPVEAIVERLTPRTRLVAVPFVLYDTGYRLDLEALGEALASHRALFCVDAIQGLGAFPLDVERARIDFLSADGHKWLLGPEGLGLLYCRADRLHELDDAPFVSWLSVQDPFGPYRPGKPLLPDTRRFEYATLPNVAVPGLAASLELILGVGVDTLATRILSVTEHLASGLDAAGWELLTPRDRDTERSGIVLARPPTGDAVSAEAILRSRGVSVTPRGAGLRFAPHGWNVHEEVDALLERLP